MWIKVVFYWVLFSISLLILSDPEAIRIVGVGTISALPHVLTIVDRSLTDIRLLSLGVRLGLGLVLLGVRA